MVKILAIGLFVLACGYVWISGDHTFAGPRYRVMAYAHMAAAQFGDLLSSTETVGQISGDNGNAVSRQSAAGAPAARDNTYVHLGSLRDATSAKEEWSRLQRTFPAHLASLDVVVERVQLGSKGVVYRVLADTSDSPLSPGQLCTALRQNNQFCTLIKPGAT